MRPGLVHHPVWWDYVSCTRHRTTPTMLFCYTAYMCRCRCRVDMFRLQRNVKIRVGCSILKHVSPWDPKHSNHQPLVTFLYTTRPSMLGHFSRSIMLALRFNIGYISWFKAAVRVKQQRRLLRPSTCYFTRVAFSPFRSICLSENLEWCCFHLLLSICVALYRLHPRYIRNFYPALKA